MAANFFPNAADFDEMNEHLEKIAKGLGVQVDVSTWGGIQRAVRAGVAPELLPVGTQLIVNHKEYGDMLYDVVAHDYLKSASNTKAHTMTLLSHNLLPTLQFDNSEAFYYADAELPAGVYNFTLPNDLGNWKLGTYQFTLSVALPAGGRLGLDCRPDVSLVGKHVYTYPPDKTEYNGSYVISNGAGGTSLGTFEIELNNAQRVAYGSNNYKESALRQWLNSSAEAGAVWTAQTKFDLPPNWVSTAKGFINGLDREFLFVVGEVKVPCSSTEFYEAPDSTVTLNHHYTLEDRFYIPSQREVFGKSENMVEDNSKLLPYYDGASGADRVKYYDGAASIWRTRTPYASGFNGTNHRVETNGNRGGGYARDSYGVAVMCTIV